jgi:hypothetical protein
LAQDTSANRDANSGKRKDEADDISREDGGRPTFDASLDHDGSKNISFSSASCHNIIPQ